MFVPCSTATLKDLLVVIAHQMQHSTLRVLEQAVSVWRLWQDNLTAAVGMGRRLLIGTRVGVHHLRLHRLIVMDFLFDSVVITEQYTLG